MTEVYLKLGAHKGTSPTENVIPLKVVTVSVSVDKQIPAFPIPLSGLATGESITAALDLGMSNKRISLSGYITETTIVKKFGTAGSDLKSVTFTAAETAQLIASGVDSTAGAKFQAMNELVVLIPSTVDGSYTEVAERNIPLTFKARGDGGELDNQGISTPATFPADSTADGISGFIQNFNFELSAETTDVTFSLEFVVATTFPRSSE